VDVGWHGGPLAHWEQDKVRRRKRADAIEKRKALDVDVKAFRKLRAVELRG
jgi:hypothetical protein